MNRQLTLVRHSLSEIKQDLPAYEWMLSEEGKARAGRLADVLQSRAVDFIATSHEPKALETAQILADRYGLAPQTIAGLHEHGRRTVPYLSRSDFETAVREFFEKTDPPLVSRLTGKSGFQVWSELGLPCFVVLDMQSKELIAFENIS